MSHLLDPNYFWGLAFLTGAAFSVWAALSGGVRVDWKEHKLDLPSMQMQWRKPCFILGVLLMGVSISINLTTNWAGWRAPTENGSDASVDADTDSLLFPAALAQQLVASLRVRAKHVYVDTQHFGRPLGFYVGEIGFAGPAQVVVFAPPPSVNQDQETAAPTSGVIASGFIGRGKVLTFVTSGTTYTVRADLKWYASGSNLAEIQIAR